MSTAERNNSITESNGCVNVAVGSPSVNRQEKTGDDRKNKLIEFNIKQCVIQRKTKIMFELLLLLDRLLLYI